MKKYELTYLVSPDLSEEEVQILIAKITNGIRDKAGSVTNTTDPSKITLGYLINKKAMAFLVSTYFSLAPESITKLENLLKEEKNVLRSTILVKVGRKEKPKRIRKIEPSPISQPETHETSKVELEEIDQKIDDILQ